MKAFLIGWCCAVAWIFPFIAFIIVKRAFGTSISFHD